MLTEHKGTQSQGHIDQTPLWVSEFCPRQYPRCGGEGLTGVPCTLADGMASAGRHTGPHTRHTLAMLRKGGRESRSLVTVEALPMARFSHKIKKIISYFKPLSRYSFPCHVQMKLIITNTLEKANCLIY